MTFDIDNPNLYTVKITLDDKDEISVRFGFRECKFHTDGFYLNGKKIKMFAEKEPNKIDWKGCGAEYIAEATGKFTAPEGAQLHFEGGAKKVVITAPAKGGLPMFVMGVNNKEYKKDMDIVSNASCTTNCLAPVVYVLQKAFGIKQGFMTTIHSYTNDQKILDQLHKDLYRARAAAMSMSSVCVVTNALRLKRFKTNYKETEKSNLIISLSNVTVPLTLTA